MIKILFFSEAGFCFHLQVKEEKGDRKPVVPPWLS
jgi:hypothetical protein